jgi:UDP-2-acetamido-3-amino-2,3-dideoxy-glucuronate N-acetyltransferase
MTLPRNPAISPDAFVHATAVVDDKVTIGAGTKIWHFSHILSHTKVGENGNIGQNVVIGPDVVIGKQCKIQNNVSVYKGVTLEDGPTLLKHNHCVSQIIPRSSRMIDFRTDFISEPLFGYGPFITR